MYNHTCLTIASTRGPWVCCAALLCLMTGCVSPWEKSALLKDNFPNINRVQGPTERSVRNVLRRKQDEEDEAAGGSLKPLAGTEEYLSATELYKDEKYVEAQKAFKKVGKKFKKSEIREDALFMEAEAAWQQDHYAKAHDVYAVLLREYPSTRHLNVVSERLFKIGRLWLDFPEVAKLGEIHQVNFDSPSDKLPSEEPPQGPKAKLVFVPNFSDKKEPLFDTAGNGVAALSAVWMNDPTGPLADDAMMLVASYHARRGNYIEADRFFQMLRETFPNSPHVQNAFLLGGHVKLMSYQGPSYETRTLREAQLLKESTLRLYPNLVEKERLEQELAQIEDQKALVLWSHSGFYLKKGNKKGSAIYCHQVIEGYPKSPYAAQARARLVELGPEYANGAILLSPVDEKTKSPLEQLLPENASFKLKRSPLIGSARNTSKSTASARSKASDAEESGPPGRSKAGEYDDSSEETEQAPAIDPDSPPKRRGWFGFGAAPEKLPPGADSEAKRINSTPPGRTRL
jgi:TolA-binding protein